MHTLRTCSAARRRGRGDEARNGQDAPSYSEAQATAWLAWLARGMQQHGQTVFLIEQLQPSWLSTRGQCWGYIFASRLIWGILIAMIVGLVARLVLGHLLLSLLPELIIIIGLILGLIDAVCFGRNRSSGGAKCFCHPAPDPSGQHAVCVDCRVDLRAALRIILRSRRLDRWSSGRGGNRLIAGLIGGPIWVFRSFGPDPLNEIQSVEVVRFSWEYIPKGLLKGLIGGLIVLLIAWPIFGLFRALDMGSKRLLIVGLINSLKINLQRSDYRVG